MVNLKQHQFSWGRRVPLSWREIGKSNFRLLCWEFHHGHLTDPSFFTQIFLPVVKMEWHLVMGREDDGCWNPYWGYRMIQVERIKNSSNLVETESFSLEYYEIRTRRDVHVSCFNVVRSFAFSTKSNPTWNVWSFLLQNWLQTHRITSASARLHRTSPWESDIEASKSDPPCAGRLGDKMWQAGLGVVALHCTVLARKVARQDAARRRRRH